MGVLIGGLVFVCVVALTRLFRYEKALIRISHYHSDSPDAELLADIAYDALHSRNREKNCR